MFHVVLLEDEMFEPFAGPNGSSQYQRVVLNEVPGEREILIAPHCHETFISVHLLKLGIYCRRNGIRLISVGTMNQLPFFAMFSDEAIVVQQSLDSMFTAESSFGFDPTPWRRLPTFVDVYHAQGPDRVEADKLPPDAVVRFYEDPTIFLRRTTWETFHALHLDEGRICCEIKRHFFPRLYQALEALSDKRLVGLDKSFQRNLVRQVGDHFMGVQILASLCKGWRFIAAGGAVNLFNVIPVHPLLYLENQTDFTPEYQYVARWLTAVRYGTLATFLSLPYGTLAPYPLEPDDRLTETMVNVALAATRTQTVAPQFRLDTMSVPARRDSVAGKHFHYTRAGFIDCDLTLARGGAIKDGPGFNEHNWFEVGDTLVFTSDDNVPRVRMHRTTDGVYVGTFVNSGTPTAVTLYAPDAGRPWERNAIVLRQNEAIVRWVFGYEHDQLFMERNILPWALPGAARVDPSQTADFTVAIYPNAEQLGRLAETGGQKFLLACEKETRHPRLHDAYSFVQAPRPDDDLTYVRYAPPLTCWCPPVSPSRKSRRCSVVDSGIYDWRRALIERTASTIGPVDIFGGTQRPLDGYHSFRAEHRYGNDKVSGLLSYAFYLSLERTVAEDYLTEKLTDAILCECVPVYHGAPNASRYIDPEAFIPISDAASYDWSGWQSLYEKKRPALRAAKEYLRTHLNVFSYFVRIIAEPSRLGDVRPI